MFYNVTDSLGTLSHLKTFQSDDQLKIQTRGPLKP